MARNPQKGGQHPSAQPECITAGENSGPPLGDKPGDLETAWTRIQQLEQELRSSRNLLQRVIEEMPIGVSVAEAPSGRALFSNKEVDRLVGKTVSSRQTAEEYTAYGAVHADGSPYRVDEYPTIRALRNGERIRDEEMRYLHPERGETFLLLNSRPLHNEDGKVVCAVTAVHDITERREMERMLAEREERLGLAIAHARVGFYEWDMETDHLTFSDRMREDWGIAAESAGFSQQHAMAFVHVDDRERVAKLMERAIRDRLPYRVEHRVVRPDGRVIWVDVTGNVLYRDGDGRKPYRFFGTSVDISERKRREEDLAATTRRLQLVLDSAAEGIYGLDRDGNCTFANTACALLLGFDRAEELLGKNMHGLIHHSHPDGTPYLAEECPIHAAFREGREVHVEGELLYRRDGSTFTGEYWARPKMQGGHVRGAVVTFLDVSERKAHAEERERLVRELQEAIATRDQFMAIASHELRTPLSSIMLQLQSYERLLHRDREKAMSYERLDTMLSQSSRQVSRLARLIDDMLDLVRIREGRLTLHPQEMDLAQLVQRELERLGPELRSASGGLPPTVRLCENAIGCWDSFRLEQVVTNLLTNAMKYGQGAPVDVELACLPDHVVLSVRDRGMGIPAEAQQRIFERFERAVDGRQIGGLGLGLFICRNIVEAHGGRISVASEAAEGSTFIVELPRWREHAGVSPRTPGQASPS